MSTVSKVGGWRLRMVSSEAPLSRSLRCSYIRPTPATAEALSTVHTLGNLCAGPLGMHGHGRDLRAGSRPAAAGGWPARAPESRDDELASL